MADELEKTLVTELTSGEKSLDEDPNITTTPPLSKSKGPVNSCGMNLPEIKILKFWYKTPEKKPFNLPKKLQVSPLCLFPTPKKDPWFSSFDDQKHCLCLIQNLTNFPMESSEQRLREKFCQFQKFVNDNDLTRVNELTNMWLQDGKQHSFPVTTPEDNTLPSAKVCLEKDFEYEELNWKYKDQ